MENKAAHQLASRFLVEVEVMKKLGHPLQKSSGLVASFPYLT